MGTYACPPAGQVDVFAGLPEGGRGGGTRGSSRPGSEDALGRGVEAVEKDQTAVDWGMLR